MAGEEERTRTRRWVAYVPNALTVLRIAMVAAFPFAGRAWRLVVVVAAALTDWVDGRIARRYGATSELGALLDGFADKAVALTVLVTLAVEGRVAWWQIALALARDLAVLVVVAVVVARRRWDVFRRMVARGPGKVTTALLFAWFIALLALPDGLFVTALFVAAAAASVLAAADYLRQFFLGRREMAATFRGES